MIAFLANLKKRLAPFDLGRGEAAMIRLGLALCVWHLFPMATYPSEPVPNGLARVLPGENFTWLDNPGTLETCRWLLLSGLVLFVLHRFLLIAYPLILGILIANGTLTNSQAAEVTHHSQIVVLVFLALAGWHLVAWLRRKRDPGNAPGSPGFHRLAFFVAIQVVMATYMVSVVSKLVLSEGKWVRNAANIPVQIQKTRLMDHYNNIGRPGHQPAPTSWSDRFSEAARDAFTASPAMARTVLTAGLILEAFCFLALLGRRTALVYGLMLICFHGLISLAMNLTFMYHIAILLLYFVGLPHWVSLLLSRWPAATKSAPSPAAP